MTGKEALEKLYSETPSESWTIGLQYDIELGAIEKDLEVLEILKDHYIKITFDTTMTKEEKQKLKEWLENEK